MSFKIVGGNISHEYDLSCSLSSCKLWHFGAPDIPLNDHIAYFEHRDTVRRFSTFPGIIGFIFGYALGFIGAFVCMAFMGIKTRYVFDVILDDNRFFVAEADKTTYEIILSQAKISIIHLNSRTSNQIAAQ